MLARSRSKHTKDPVVRVRLEIRGRVQGVGFRPFVYRLATEMGLGGHVGNDSRGAFIEVEGSGAIVERFTGRLQTELPALAEITSLTASHIPPLGERSFAIRHSVTGDEQEAEVVPDAATCDACLRELFDPADRRYRYPFINCTNCGPRYSIIRAVPYDRPNTTMGRFVMCPACRAEYDDPADRRFHAQPNACPACGPRVWMCSSDGAAIPGDPIETCAAWLRDGRIVAIKGLGGFHLACRADDDEAVERLRRRKSREAKPLAIMAASLEQAAEIVELDESARAAMTGPARPIVLAPKQAQARISRHVAPGTASFGVMLPYTPLHHLLFAQGLGPLVMTSGNPSDEPLCSDNDEALSRLGRVADAFLLHDRDIERRVDDSVVMIAAGRAVPVRRARGHVPGVIQVPDRGAAPVLAVGGELKSTVCLLAGGRATMSEHLGELPNPAAYRNFVATIEQFKRLLRLEPKVVACDMHPDYAAMRYARGVGLPLAPVQHHHAHIVSCMADNGINGQVVGISCDGTGYGTDGAIWGCEVMVCDEADFERAGHLAYFPLLGGDAAARDTWRPAVGLLEQAFGPEWRKAADFALARVDPRAIALAGQRLAGRGHIPQTSSLGRLFDAVAFLLGVCDRNRYEGEAPIALEALAANCPTGDLLDYRVVEPNRADGGLVTKCALTPCLMDVGPMVRELVNKARAGEDVARLARAFHETVAAMLADGAGRVAARHNLNRVVLSGGCFANRLLLEGVAARLRSAGREIFTHRQVPPGDGGISLGQAVCAAERAARGMIT